MDRCSNVKNNKSAKTVRIKGNVEFANGNFLDALLLYNESICLSVPGSMTLALGYGKRSAVYFRTGYYEICLDNIDLAKENLPPKHSKKKFNKLMNRAIICMELMKKKKPKYDNNPWSFFKLSYPSNPKIPFIIDCLELTKEKVNIRSVKTNKSLKFGDIVSIESPLYPIVDQKALYFKCANCFTTHLLDLFPCERCITSEYSCLNNYSIFKFPNSFPAMYCSEKCLDYADKYYHQYECIVIDSLRASLCDNFLLAIRSFYINYTICGSMDEFIKFMCKKKKFCSDFDFNLESPNMEQNYIKMIVSLPRSTTNTSNLVQGVLQELFSRHPKMKNIWKSDIYQWYIVAFVDRVMNTSLKHGFYSYWWSMDQHGDPTALKSQLSVSCGLYRHHSGLALLPFTSMIKLSCTPNCVLIPVNRHFVLITVRPIKANENLTICRW